MAGRYTFNNTKKLSDGREVYTSKVLPKIPKSDADTYIAVQTGDRLYSIAQEYLGDASLWWVISTANPQYSGASLFPGGGLQIRIPFPIQNVINDFNAVNG